MEKETGRNEPCPCASGKKFKRCHGIEAAPPASAPQIALPPSGAMAAPGGMPGGFDPSQLDPQAMAQVAQAMKRLPKSQVQRLQSLVQKAMAGKDVTREAAELEGVLPPDFQSLMMSLAPQMMAAQGGAAAPAPMSEDEARRIVAEAAAKGEVSAEKAEELLGEKPVLEEGAAKGGKGWKSIFGKK